MTRFVLKEQLPISKFNMKSITIPGGEGFTTEFKKKNVFRKLVIFVRFTNYAFSNGELFYSTNIIWP